MMGKLMSNLDDVDVDKVLELRNLSLTNISIEA
jgi:hypothetical protein